MGKIYTSDKKYINDTKKFLKASLEDFKPLKILILWRRFFNYGKILKAKRKVIFR